MTAVGERSATRPEGVVGGGPPSRPSAPAEGRHYKFIAAGVVMIGAIMVILDQTVVIVAIPTLEREFKATLSDVQWIITAYTLALAAVIPLTGWLTDRYGTKRIFVISQVLFVIGSVLCGLTWSNASLIGFRILQGLGGGLIMPVGMTILMSVTRPEERGRMMAVMGIPMLFGPVLGPTLGGLLVQDVSWRFIFFINLPIGLIGALLSLTQLREKPNRVAKREPLDMIGLILVTPAVLGLVYGLSQPSNYGWWSLETVLPLAAGIVLLVAFCLFELRTRYPLIDIRVFRDGAFAASMSLNFLIGLGLFGAIFLLPVFLQQIQGYGAFDAGLLLAFQGLGAAAGMPIAGILTDKIGARRVVPFGLTIITIATIWMTMLTPTTSAATIAAMLALRGFGMGFSFMPSMSAAFVTLAPDRIARATSISNVVQRVASGLGIAIMATVLTNRISANLPRLPQGGGLPSSSGDLASAHLPPAIKTVLLEQATKGFNETFWVGAGLVLIAFPMTLLLRRALTPEAVRSHAVRQASEGIVLGMAALKLRDGRFDGSILGNVDRSAAFKVFAGAALTRLQKAMTLLKAGTNASGLVPQPGLSLGRRVSFVVVLVAAVAASVLAIVHGYQAAQVPTLATPPARVQVAAPAPPGAAQAAIPNAATAPTASGAATVPQQTGVQVLNRPAPKR